ncbi:MAG: ABC transporter ATP-binding protein/permease [Firmicutes bacterium]|nr:ABC transporter ATP-binding protein/permease [Bacillota bacterium]
MLKLVDIVKDYKLGKEDFTRALGGVSLEFGSAQFVSILGPSGCGKTTLLNIIGGLDQYTSGDLIINGVSTKNYKDRDWDAYRNSTIGFIFQSYNLIPHLSILENVAIALSISGVGPIERHRRAKEALISVGLEGHLKKRPNQLSGGQMQRVAIARALVNDPKILMADEPTGALDSVTSVQVMELIKEISTTRLVIMVTHNRELALEYSDRIIELKDGLVVNDEVLNQQVEQTEKQLASAPIDYAEIEQATEVADNLTDTLLDDDTNQQEFFEGGAGGDFLQKNRPPAKKLTKEKPNRTVSISMGFSTALNLSGKNLLTKKIRTAITAIAGSIGIIGLALVLALSGGLNHYATQTANTTLASFPLSMWEQTNEQMPGGGGRPIPEEEFEQFPDTETLYVFDREDFSPELHFNNFTNEFVEYLQGLNPELFHNINIARGLNLNVLVRRDAGLQTDIHPTAYGWVNTTSGFNWGGRRTGSFFELPQNQDFLNLHYEIIEGRPALEKNETVIIVDRFNRIERNILNNLGIDYNENHAFSDIVGRTMRVVHNNDRFIWNGYRTLPGGIQVPNIQNLGTSSEQFFDPSPNATAQAQRAVLYQNPNNIELEIVGIKRIIRGGVVDVLPTGVGFTTELIDYMLESAANSDIALLQAQYPFINLRTGLPFPANPLQFERESRLEMLRVGTLTNPTGIQIVPTSFSALHEIRAHIRAWNARQPSHYDHILYNNIADEITDLLEILINAVTIVLVALVSISLLVSSIMIGIITYVSVVERTREIGVLRAVGARKKDISRVFSAEAVLIGFTSGVFGVIIGWLLTFPFNWITAPMISGETGVMVGRIAQLPWWQGLLLIGVSTFLTLLAGYIPSKIAAKKDPVVALRTE